MTLPSAAPRDRATIPAAHVLFLLLVAGCFFFAALGRLPLIEPDEGRNAEVAREMLAAADWVTPHYDTLPYLDKPAPFFWLVAASFRIFGISEWAARFPSALMAVGTMLLVWTLARRMFGDSAGLRAGLVFASSPLVLGVARVVTFDMTLTFFVTLALVSFRVAEDEDFRRLAPALVLFAAMGIATIIKGPVGFLLPLLSLLAYAAARGKLRELKRLRWGLGTIVFLAVTLPWFIAVSVRNPGFPRYAFWEESILRFTTGHAHRSGSVFYYIPVYFAGFFPWSLVLFVAALNRLRSWKGLRLERHRASLFLTCWGAVVFVFFSISRSKLPAYFLPALVPLSILVGRLWSDLDSTDAVPADWLNGGFAALMLVGFVMAALPHLARYGLHWNRWTMRVPPGSAELISGTVLYSGLILIALSVLGRMTTRRRGREWPWVTFALLVSATPLLALRSIPVLKLYADSISSCSLASTILASPERDLPVYGYYYFRTSLGFYLRRPVGLVTEDGDELTSNYVVALLAGRSREGRSSPPGTLPPGGAGPGVPVPLLLNAQDLKNLAETSSQPFLVMARNNEVDELAKTVGTFEPRWTGWQYSIWEVGGEHH